MSEKLEIFDLNSNFLGVQERKEFYSEIKQEYQETGSITRKIKRVSVLLMNSSGRIFLQKRSQSKKENSGLYDKSVGGHVVDSDSYTLTTIKECAEELGFPATILSSEDFMGAINSTDLSIVGVFKEVGFEENSISIRVSKDGTHFKQPYMTSIYIGYYDGAIKFVDGESSGIEVFSLDELKGEIKENPLKFTEDLKYLIEKYEKELVAI